MSLQDEVILHTLRIISTKDNKTIERIGGGCLVLYRDIPFLLTVAHLRNTKESKITLVLHNLPELSLLPNWYNINPTFLRRGRTRFPFWLEKKITRISNNHTDDIMNKHIKNLGKIDFAVSAVNLPFVPIFSLPINSGYVGCKYHAFDYSQIVEPSKQKKYAFYGLTHFRYENNQPLCDEVYLEDLEYIKTDSVYHIFKISKKINNLKGCSGSPILDQEGNLVSIVVRKSKFWNNYIYGINLKAVTIAFQIEANQITGVERYE